MDDDEARDVLHGPRPSLDALVEVYLNLTLDADIREAALNHPAMPSDKVRELINTLPRAQAEAVVVRTTHADVLADLAQSADPSWRAIVAFNPATPTAVVRLLLRDGEPRVRSNAVYNPRASRQSVEYVANHDHDREVREAAADALDSDLGNYLRAGERNVIVSAEEEPTSPKPTR